MLKRLLSLVLAAVLMAACVPAVMAEEPEGQPLNLEEMYGVGEFKEPKTMYVYTENGGALNVRSEPRVRDNVIDQLNYGTEVTVTGIVVIDPDWAVIKNKKGPDGLAYVMRRFLVDNKPERSQKQIDDEQKVKNLEELNRQLATAKDVDQPFMIAVRTTRTSGWINFRVGPGVAADRIASFPDGKELKVVGETAKWYKAIDLDTGKTGYISKNYVSVLATPVEPETPEKTQLGKLNVNEEFTLQCELPEGYNLQVVNMQGTKIVASVLSQDVKKPMLYLSIAYNELYSSVERMNDLGEADLKVLEESFTDMNEVEISYTETKYGTKLMVAREVGSDTDFVDILTVYKGYSIEFVMTPNPDGGVKELTDEQIQMCVNFLSELDFIPVVRTGLVTLNPAK